MSIFQSADKRTPNELIEAIKMAAPGFYTERDGGDWYCVTANHDRVAEDFASRRDARLCILWLAGEPMPKGWKIESVNDLSARIDCGQGYAATVWTRSVAKAFPPRHADLLRANA